MRTCLSHNIWVPEQTTDIGPFAAIKPPGQHYNTAKSAVRALDVLEVLSQSPVPLRAIDIARAIGLSPSSADQILKTLVDTAYLTFDPLTKRYYPSPRLAKLGAWMSSAYFPEGALERLVDDVYRILDRSVHVLTSQGTFMQGVMSVGPIVPIKDEEWRHVPRLPVGFRVPLFGSSSGAAWLSRQSEATIEACIELCRRELGPREPARIFQLIEDARRKGYVCGGVSPDNETCGIAFPLPKARNGLTLVMSVAAPIPEIKAKEFEFATVVKQKIAECLPTS
jgi:DNA-binding IclR family transcriptional regulator